MRANILHNYIAQIFLASAGLITLPFLLDKMGAELYAFVAILFSLQTIFSILDGGLSGTLSREFALKTSLSEADLSANALFKVTEIVFLSLALLGFALIVLLSGYISDTWLQLSNIEYSEAQEYLIVIGGIASLRLLGGLYRSVLIGFEKQKLLSYINISSTGARYFFVLPLLGHFGSSGYLYFLYQLGVAIIELVALKLYASNIIVDLKNAVQRDIAKSEDISSIFHKSAQIWLLTLIWVAANQVDKLILSRVMLLDQFAYFSVVSALASGLLMLSSPITNAAMPKMSVYFMEQRYAECEVTYFNISSILSLVAVPIALTLMISPEHALFLFSNSKYAALKYSFVLTLYSLGSLFLLLSGMTFLLQQIKGDLKQNIRQNFKYLLVLLASMLAMITVSDVYGAAYAWLFSNALLIMHFIRPLNKLHRRELHGRWLRFVLLRPFVVSLPSIAMVTYFKPVITSKIDSFVWLALVFIGIFVPLMLVFLLRNMKKNCDACE
jgi:O-antigen/teichoic acid export membrane protein